MPRLLEHIDRIARKKKRAVVFVSFEPSHSKEVQSISPAPYHYYSDYENDINRQALIDWLDAHGLVWEPCGHFASEPGHIAYNGNIYIDVPWDNNDTQYIEVRTHLENSDGTMKNPCVKFWGVTLEEAMTNAHHDEPGFWEKWAENF